MSNRNRSSQGSCGSGSNDGSGLAERENDLGAATGLPADGDDIHDEHEQQEEGDYLFEEDRLRAQREAADDYTEEEEPEQDGSVVQYPAMEAEEIILTPEVLRTWGYDLDAQSPPGGAGNNTWMGDVLSNRRPEIPPHSGEVYTSSKPMNRQDGWSYEVRTDKVDYRISTTPSDFLGVGPEDWPQELKDEYEGYKGLQAPWYRAISKYKDYANLDLKDNEHLYRLARDRYDRALEYARGRREFLLRWPSAYERHDGTENHWKHPKDEVTDMEHMRTIAKNLHKKIWPEKDPEEWTEKRVELRDLMGRPLYAMAEDQYAYLRAKKMEKKRKDRTELEDSWVGSPSSYQDILKPDLPLLNPLPPATHGRDPSTLRITNTSLARLIPMNHWDLFEDPQAPQTYLQGGQVPNAQAPNSTILIEQKLEEEREGGEEAHESGREMMPRTPAKMPVPSPQRTRGGREAHGLLKAFGTPLSPRIGPSSGGRRRRRLNRTETEDPESRSSDGSSVIPIHRRSRTSVEERQSPGCSPALARLSTRRSPRLQERYTLPPDDATLRAERRVRSLALTTKNNIEEDENKKKNLRKPRSADTGRNKLTRKAECDNLKRKKEEQRRARRSNEDEEYDMPDAA